MLVTKAHVDREARRQTTGGHHADGAFQRVSVSSRATGSASNRPLIMIGSRSTQETAADFPLGPQVTWPAPVAPQAVLPESRRMPSTITDNGRAPALQVAKCHPGLRFSCRPVQTTS